MCSMVQDVQDVHEWAEWELHAGRGRAPCKGPSKKYVTFIWMSRLGMCDGGAAADH